MSGCAIGGIGHIIGIRICVPQSPLCRNRPVCVPDFQGIPLLLQRFLNICQLLECAIAEKCFRKSIDLFLGEIILRRIGQILIDVRKKISNRNDLAAVRLIESSNCLLWIILLREIQTKQLIQPLVVSGELIAHTIGQICAAAVCCNRHRIGSTIFKSYRQLRGKPAGGHIA